MATLDNNAFHGFQRLIYRSAGVSLSDEKRTLVENRLARRLSARGLDSFHDYLALLESGGAPDEYDVAIDLLTTHETYFMREPRHFAHLAEVAAAHDHSRPLRVWSAACSTGEEAYSSAMTLAACMAPGSFDISASDVSGAVLERARAGIFPLDRARGLSPAWLRRYCLRGRDEYAGSLLVVPALRRCVNFHRINLDTTLPANMLGMFDVVFLRNVMIYFGEDTKRAVLARVAAQIRPGGYLYVGHAESVRDPAREGLVKCDPAIYRKSGA